MTLVTKQGTTRDKENKSFVESPVRGENFSAQEVAVSSTGLPFAPPANADAITVTYPTTSTEVYSYRNGGIGGAVINTVTVTYASASKKDLVSVVVT